MALPRDPRDAVHQNLLEAEVEQADRDAQDHRQDDDHPGGLVQLGAGGPGDLPHLGPGGHEKIPRRRDAAARRCPIGGRAFCQRGVRHLLRFLVDHVLVAVRAVLAPLDALRVLPLVLVTEEVAILAVGALENDLVAWHVAVPLRYFRILVTTPAPTVRPPSRMAKRSPSSMAIGMISSIVIWMLSPGITISTPAGSSTLPVTSVVRK